MKIYTRGGDHGQTSLLGGKRVPKSDLRLKTYGSIDELNSLVGVCVSLAQPSGKKELEEIANELIKIQHLLFDCGNDFSTPNPDHYPYRTKEEDISWLEERIDQYSLNLPSLKQFILPGGSQLASQLHVARTTTRRCERLAVEFSLENEINSVALKFLNRLSDYFFVLARYANYLEDVPEVLYQTNN